jgi:hypothetical protein
MTPSPPPDRRTIGIIGASLEGWRRVLRAPAVVLGLFAVTFVISISQPFILASSDTRSLDITHDVGAGELVEAMTALGGPVAGVGAAIDEGIQNPQRAASMIASVVLGMFLWGGVIDRLARARPLGPAAFFGACGRYLGRMLRLAVPFIAAYWVVARLASTPSYLTAAGLAGLTLVAEFARTRAVVEDRWSALGAIIASLRFIRRHALAAVLLFLLNWLTLGILGGIWTWAGDAGLGLWPVLFIGLLLPLLVRLGLAAGNVVLFQSALAHANYTAAPLPIWPDSPAAEAIENLVARQHSKN